MILFLRLFLLVITQPGAHVTGLNLASPVNHAGGWLCLYERCPSGPGGLAYGSAILVLADDVTVEGNTIRGGVTGIAAKGVKGLTVRDNTISDVSGWGVYLQGVQYASVQDNWIEEAIRSCPESPDGCESAGIMLLGTRNSFVERNTVVHAGNGVYLNGEGEPSDFNYLAGNEIIAASHNGFEITFSTGNVVRDNVIHGDGRACLYPLWVGGSHIWLGKNETACIKSLERGLNDSRESTSVPTIVERVR